VAILALANQVIVVQPSQPFKVEEMRIDPVIAPNFLINDVRVGRYSAFLGAGAVPATAFSAVNPNCTIGLDTAQTSEPIQVNVTNTSAAAAFRFLGTFIGLTVE
jgi:hypothetical protein